MTLSFSLEDSELENRNPLNFSPYEKFMYALKSKESKRQYPKRLQIFFDFISIKSDSIEKNCNGYGEKSEGKNDSTSWLKNELFRFFSLQNQRVELDFQIAIGKNIVIYLI